MHLSFASRENTAWRSGTRAIGSGRKGYNIANAAKVDENPLSLMKQWRHDDEHVANGGAPDHTRYGWVRTS
ncbi:MAG TPA: hypothetical protein VGM84_13100 [Steroidobacteraceae bacterium]